MFPSESDRILLSVSDHGHRYTVMRLFLLKIDIILFENTEKTWR